MLNSKFEQIYNEYYSQLVFFCYKVLGNKMDAEDAVGNVFYNLLKIGKTDIEKIRGYLYISAINECRNVIRRKKTQDKAYSKGIDADEVDYIKLKSALIDAAFKQANLKLQPKAKDIFLLKYIHGLSSKEISVAVNRSISTVRNTLSQSLQKIRPAFNQYEY